MNRRNDAANGIKILGVKGDGACINLQKKKKEKRQNTKKRKE